MLTFTKTTLSNGMRVVFVPHADTAAATVLVLFEVGSRYEPKKLHGGSHFIEHMMFKGTERRPATIDISRDLDSVGADYNAFTGKDYTGYYIKLQADKLSMAIDMLEDMVFHSLYRQKDLTSECDVIIEEIRMYEDNPMMQVEELMEEELFKGSTLGWKISGTPNTMRAITRDDLTKFRDSHYTPSRMVVAVSGKYDHDATVALLEKTFGKALETGTPKSFDRFRVAKAGYRAPRVRIQYKETEQVQMAIGFPAYPYRHKQLPALSVLSVILGGTMSSRLFLSVREKHGLAYFIRSSTSPYQDVGALTIQAGLAKDKVHNATELIMRELHRIREKPVSKEELRRAQDYIKGKVVLGLEDSSRTADWFGKQELLTGKIDSIAQGLARISAVTREDVARAAREVIVKNRMTIALIGPFKDEKAFARHADVL